MKKIIFIIVLSMLVTSLPVTSIAKNNIYEKPGYKTVFNGKVSSYKNNPIAVNGKMYFPYKDFLKSIGVKDDKTHIIWDSKNKSLTIIKDKQKITMKESVSSAVVNGKTIKAEAPITYKKTLYVPSGFIMDNLGIDYIVDNEVNMILACSHSDIEKNYSQFEKFDSNLLKVNRFKYEFNITTTIYSDNTKTDYYQNTCYSSIQVDNEKKISYEKSVNTTLPDQTSDTDEDYILFGKEYTKNIKQSAWKETSYDMSSFLYENIPTISDDVSTLIGMKLQPVSDKNLIRFKGNTYQQGTVDALIEGYKEEDKGISIYPKSFFTEISIDKNLNCLKDLHTEIVFDYVFKGNHFPLVFNFTLKVTDINANFSIDIPDDIAKKNKEYQASVGTWAKKSDIPVNIDEPAVAEVSGKIYALGGHNKNLYEYNPSLDTWKTKGELPMSKDPYYLERMAAVGLNGKLYVIGGKDSNQLWSYDPGTELWEHKADMSQKRTLPGVAVYNGKIYVSGGYSGDEKKMEVYDPSTNSWSYKSSMLTGRFKHNLAVLNNKLYAFGGYGYEKKIEVYDFSSDTWTSLPDAPYNIAGLGAVTYKGKIYMMANYDGESLVCYDPGKKVWSRLPKGLNTRENVSCVLANNKFYTIGGSSLKNKSNIIEEFTPPKK
ncbi:MAG TPA: stalk domain-containing protein [Clostridia bacterium]|nr:stalk domain-containing protein [Clostridia bacterium]